jgi:hypothetical protein
VKAIPGFPNYFATEDGRIWSRPRPSTKGGFLKMPPDNNGYPLVTLHRDGKQYPTRVHVLVMLAFQGPCPEGLEVRHLDGNPANSGLRNLRYGTGSENTLDTIAHGRHHMARKTHCKHGHEFTPENTFVPAARPNGRHCRKCIDRRSKARAGRKDTP